MEKGDEKMNEKIFRCVDCGRELGDEDWIEAVGDRALCLSCVVKHAFWDDYVKKKKELIERETSLSQEKVSDNIK